MVFSDGRILGGGPRTEGSERGSPRAWIGIWFRCAGIYTRAYRNEAGTCYERRCPRCGRPVRFAIGPEGVSDRCFEVWCER